MAEPILPPFCAACIDKAQAQCPHEHTDIVGHFTYAEGNVWDDLHEFCCDCGTDLSYLNNPLSLFYNSLLF